MFVISFDTSLDSGLHTSLNEKETLQSGDQRGPPTTFPATAMAAAVAVQDPPHCEPPHRTHHGKEVHHSPTVGPPHAKVLLAPTAAAEAAAMAAAAAEATAMAAEATAMAAAEAVQDPPHCALQGKCWLA